MIKKGIYYALRFYVRVGLSFFFKEIAIQGRANIPKYKPVIFLANHQNAFLDALLLVSFNHRHTHFVARADVFKNKFAQWLLGLINIMPIYRIRDGWQSLNKNHGVFNQCFNILLRCDALIIFPEGNHDLSRRLRPLSKGFTRIAFGTQQRAINQSIYIVPVGLNYSAHQKFRSSVNIHFGQPILVADYYKTGDPQEANALRGEVARQMKMLIAHIEDEVNYETTVAQLDARNPDYLDPYGTNLQLKDKTIINENNRAAAPVNTLLYPLAVTNNILVILLWRWIKTFVKDPAFVGSIKFCFGIFLVPLTLGLQAGLMDFFLGFWWSLGYFFISILLVPYLSKR